MKNTSIQYNQIIVGDKLRLHCNVYIYIFIYIIIIINNWWWGGFNSHNFSGFEILK